MENRRIMKVFLITVGVAVTYFIVSHFYSKHRREEIKRTPSKYVYETYWGAVNPVLFISDLKYKDDYLSYYKRVKNGERTASFNFPLKGMPQNEPVYILGYTHDSLLVKIVSFYNRGRVFGGSYTEGYVFPEALHNRPPTDKK